MWSWCTTAIATTWTNAARLLRPLIVIFCPLCVAILNTHRQLTGIWIKCARTVWWPVWCWSECVEVTLFISPKSKLNKYSNYEQLHSHHTLALSRALQQCRLLAWVRFPSVIYQGLPDGEELTFAIVENCNQVSAHSKLFSTRIRKLIIRSVFVSKFFIENHHT